MKHFFLCILFLQILKVSHKAQNKSALSNLDTCMCFVYLFVTDTSIRINAYPTKTVLSVLLVLYIYIS